MAGPTATAPQTFLQIVRRCDNFRLTDGYLAGETLATWRLTSSPTSPAIGLLRPPIVAQLRAENGRQGDLPTWEFTVHEGKETVSFAAHVNTAAARTSVMKELCERWRDEGLWADVIGPRKWREEMYAVYRNPFGVRDAPTPEEEAGDAYEVGEALRRSTGGEQNYAFMMERSACALFGVVTYGVHMTIYETPDEYGSLQSCKVWVPMRSKSKQTWPGYLDNSVAGGIPSGLGLFESLVKESMEEASLAEDVVRQHARAAGSVSYFFRTGAGWLQPEIEYVYDLRVPAGADQERFKPKPLDGEVESFELLPLDEVVAHIRTGLFKPNTALVLLDFMIRRGYITPEDEPDYQEIVTRLHGRFQYEIW